MKKLRFLIAALILPAIVPLASPAKCSSSSGKCRFPDAVRYEYADSFANPGSPFYSVFESDITLLPATSPKIEKAIGEIVRDQLNGFVFAGSGKSIKKFPGKMKSSDDMMRACYQGYKQIYLNQYAGETTAPPFAYYIKVKPEWVSPDGTLATYSFYTYADFGGAHGMKNQWMRTFRLSDGKQIGYKNIFVKKSYGVALAELSARLKKIKDAYNKKNGLPANTNPVNPAVLSPSDMGGMKLTEKYRGQHYPWPALTENGVNFSYQPYEEGPYSQGAISVTIPYTSLHTVLNPDIILILEKARK